MARSFSGSPDTINFGDINGLDGLGACTYSIWGRVTSIPSLIVAMRKDNNFAIQTTGNNAIFWINDGSWRNSGGGSSSLATGEWIHIAGTYDGTYIRLWVNGVNESSNNFGATTLSSNSDPLHVGSRAGAGFHWINGDLAEPAIWNVALPPAEIRAIAGRRATPDMLRPDSLQIYAPLFGAGGLEQDFSRFRNHGTPTAGVTQAKHPITRRFDRDLDGGWAVKPAGAVATDPVFHPIRHGELDHPVLRAP